MRVTIVAILLLSFGGPILLFAERPSPVPADSLPEKLPVEKIPLGLDPRPEVKDNPLSEARVALGRRLFFDSILSADNTIACASCHRPDRGFSGGSARSLGIGGQATVRRAPTLFNRAYGKSLFWDGRASTLEEQALRPIENPAEMGSSVETAVQKVKADAKYQSEFKAAFTDGVTAANLGKALASFERVLLRGDSPVDRFRKLGQHDALTPAQRHGLWLYESKGLCWRCHSGPNFTDEKFHNTGVGWGKEPADLGRFNITKNDGDRGRFKTPTLRGAALTAPYMHDGSLKTLEEVVEFYNKGGQANPHLDPIMEPLKLSPDDVQALVEFLKIL